jgi:hypothetical protein
MLTQKTGIVIAFYTHLGEKSIGLKLSEVDRWIRITANFDAGRASRQGNSQNHAGKEKSY